MSWFTLRQEIKDICFLMDKHPEEWEYNVNQVPHDLPCSGLDQKLVNKRCSITIVNPLSLHYLYMRKIGFNQILLSLREKWCLKRQAYRIIKPVIKAAVLKEKEKNREWRKAQAKKDKKDLKKMVECLVKKD